MYLTDWPIIQISHTFTENNKLPEVIIYTQSQLQNKFLHHHTSHLMEFITMSVLFLNRRSAISAHWMPMQRNCYFLLSLVWCGHTGQNLGPLALEVPAFLTELLIVSYTADCQPTFYIIRSHERGYIHTGIFDVLKNSSRASRDPSVEAWTNTPRSDSLIELSTSFNASPISSCK